MASPLFDGYNLFDSVNPDESTLTQGWLYAESFSYIIETIHFESDFGNRYLQHGCGDRQWVFDGYLSATNLADLLENIADIQEYAADAGTDDYYTLQDCYGQQFDSAQIHMVHASPPLANGSGGYICKLTVTGVISGQEMDGL